MGRPTTSALFLLGIGGASCLQGEAMIFPGPTSLWIPGDPALPIVVVAEDVAPVSLAGAAFVVEYDWTLEELQLGVGALLPVSPDDCGARTLGTPRRVTRIESTNTERAEVSVDLIAGGARLPSIDIDACARQKGCLSVERGFSVCKKTCGEPPEPEAPRAPPRVPAPPDFCEADDCPRARRDCATSAAIPGEIDCVDLEPCGGDTFRAATPRGLEPRWVDASAPVGGDGSMARPYRSFAEALLDGASDVYLAAGDYALPLTFDRELSIYGACASRTRVSVPTTVESTSRLWLEGLRVEGSAMPQLRVSNGSMVATEVVFAGGQEAITASVGTEVRLSRCRLGPYRRAIFAEGASLSIEDGVIDLTDVPAGGAAIHTQRTTASVARALFAGPTTAGSAARFEEGAAALRQVAVLGVVVGISAIGAMLEASDLYLDGEGADAPIANRSGILVDNSPGASLERVMLRRLPDHGLFFRESGMVEVTDLTSIEVGPASNPEGARGSIRADKQAQLSVFGWRSLDDLRPFSSIGGISTLEDVYLRGGRGRAQAGLRTGEGKLVLRRLVIENWRNHGINVTSLGELDAEDLRVQTGSTAVFNSGDQRQASITVRRAVLRGRDGVTFIGIDLRATDVDIEADEVGFSGILGGENRGALFERFHLRGGLRAFDAVDLGHGSVVLTEGSLSGPPGTGLRCAPLRRWTVRDVPLDAP